MRFLVMIELKPKLAVESRDFRITYIILPGLLKQIISEMFFLRVIFRLVCSASYALVQYFYKEQELEITSRDF